MNKENYSDTTAERAVASADRKRKEKKRIECNIDSLLYRMCKNGMRNKEIALMLKCSYEKVVLKKNVDSN